jgi:hypothetical protein
MRNLIILITTTLLLSQLSLSAQEEEKKVVDKPARNIFKINLPAIALRNYSFQYEFVVSKRVSFAFAYSTMPNGPLPFQSTLLSFTGINDPTTTKVIQKMQTGNTAITPEIRFYISKKGYGRGFYFAPFYRSVTYNASQINVDYTTGSTGTKTFPISGSVKTQTVGLLLGTQWSLKKWLNLDWWIIGPQYGHANGSLTKISNTTLSADEQSALSDKLNSIKIPYATKTVTVTANSAKVDVDGPWADVRAGLALGVKF